MDEHKRIYELIGVKTVSGEKGDSVGKQWNSPSIPSKYDVIITQRQPGAKGFGSRSGRFGDYSTDQPGPGAYYKALHDYKSGTSYSAKGYGGGFVSQAPRLSKRRAAAMPGPGTYDIPTTITIQKRPPPSHIVPVSANQIRHDVARHEATRLNVTPGPGEYRPELPGGLTRYRRSLGANFRSTSKRDGYLGRSSTAPPPGSYEVSKAFQYVAGREHTYTAGFRSPIRRRSTEEVPAASPGPGWYEPTGTIGHPKSQGTRFGPPSDRFKNSFIQPVDTPSPDAYAPDFDMSQLRRKDLLPRPAKSGFQSSSERTAFPASPKSPGPGDYSPRLSRSQSMNTNPGKQWIG